MSKTEDTGRRKPERSIETISSHGSSWALFDMAAKGLCAALVISCLALNGHPANAQNAAEDTVDEDSAAAGEAQVPTDDSIEEFSIQFDIDDPAPARIHVTPNLRVGFAITFEADSERNYDLDGDLADDLSTGVLRAQASLAYVPTPWFEFFANLQLKRDLTFKSENIDVDENTSLEVRQAYVTLRDIYKYFSARIGRQRIKDEREWLFDDQFDAVSLFYRKGRLGIEASISRRALVDLDFLEDDDEEKTTNYFLQTHYTAGSDQTISAYVVVRDAREPGRGHLLLAGIRSAGEVIDDLEYWADFGGSFGKADASGLLQAKDKIRGFGGDIGLTYTFDKPTEPALTLGYAFGSGDRDGSDGTDYSFRQSGLQDNTAHFNGLSSFKYYGEVLDPELNNLGILTIGAGLQPFRHSSVDILYHRYRQHRRADDLRDTDIERDPNGLSRNIGQAVDLIFAYRRARRLNAELTVGYFAPGRAFDERDDAWLIGAKIRYRI